MYISYMILCQDASVFYYSLQYQSRHLKRMGYPTGTIASPVVFLQTDAVGGRGFSTIITSCETSDAISSLYFKLSKIISTIIAFIGFLDAAKI